jgi:S-adenosylmethionine hydrolase
LRIGKTGLELKLGRIVMPTPINCLHRFGFLGLAIVMNSLASVTPAEAASAPVIGLFTDYGWDDPYVSQLKGVILTINPDARILDLTHSAAPFNITEGAYLLDKCSEEFPAGTIFVAVVDPGVGTDRDPVLLETGKDKFFIGPDNGLFTRVLAREGFLRAWTLDKPELFRSGDTSRTFHGRDIFAPIAAHLAAGLDPDRLGTPLKTLVLLPDQEPSFSGGLIFAEVIHIDRFGNVILNVPSTGDLADKLKEGTLVKISMGKAIPHRSSRPTQMWIRGGWSFSTAAAACSRSA